MSYIFANILRTKQTDANNGKGICFDTGIKPSSSLNVNAMFCIYGYAQTYVFGARNTSSTSSQGQFGFYSNGGSNGTGKDAVLYNNQQKASATGGVTFTDNTYLENDGYKFVMNYENAEIQNLEGNNTEFTGLNNIYIGALNNNGAILYGSSNIRAGYYAFRFFENGNKIADFVPAYDTDNNRFGLYDQLNDVFKPNIGNGDFEAYHLLKVEEGEGGDAYIETVNSGLVKEMYCSYLSRDVGDDLYMTYDTVIKAIPRKGYVFKNWTINGEFFSKEEIVETRILEDTTIKANFIKIEDMGTTTGYTVMAIKYGFAYDSSFSAPNASAGLMFARAESFEVKEDGLGKTTSKIVMQNIPSGFQNGIPLFLMSSKGKTLYIGIISSIEDRTIYCREVLSLFDFDYVFNRFFNNTKTIPVIALTKIGQLKQGSIADVTDAVHQYELISRKFSFLYQYKSSRLSFNRPMLFTMPSAQAGISNMEEYFQNFFNDFGLYVKPSLIGIVNTNWPNKGTYQLLGMTIEYNAEDPLVFGDNTESIQDVSIDVQGDHATILFVMNEATTLTRGIFVLKTDGTAVEIPAIGLSSPAQYIAYNECVSKVVWTDDDMRTTVEGNLTNGNYNHKITFTVDLSYGQFRFEDFNIGRRVDFYTGGKLYHSVITAREFESSSDSSEIKSMKVTLGKVRNTLTSKLNLGKVK